MSDRRHSTTGCLDAETIAAFMDGRLEPREREAVEAHLAECEDCYEVWMEAGTNTQPVAAPERGSVLAGLSRPVWLAAAAVAAVATLMVWVGPFSRSARTDRAAARAIEELARGSVAYRFTHGRLSAQSVWSEKPSPNRSSTAAAPPLAVQAAAIRLLQLQEESRTARTLHGAGIAHLASGAAAEAIAALEDAVLVAPDDTSVLTDLSAAYLERWFQASEAVDLTRALDAAERAVRAGGAGDAAWFNRALTLTEMKLGSAVAAWSEFLSRITDPDWRAEAQQYLDRLKEGAASGSEAAHPLADVSSDRRTLDLLARQRPWVLEQQVTDALDRRSRSDGVPRFGDTEALRQAAAALRAAGRDHFLFDVVNDMAGPDAKCAAEVWRLLRRSSAAYDQSDYATSEGFAAQAMQRASCSRAGRQRAAVLALWARFDQGRRAEAAADAHSLLSAAMENASWWDASRVAWMIARLDAGTGRADPALAMYGKGLATAQRSGSPELVAALNTLIAEILTEFGDPIAASRHIQDAVVLLDHLTPRRRHIVLTGAAHSAMALGLPSSADVFASLLAQNADVWGNPAGQISAALQRARAAAGVGGHARAERILTDGRLWLDRLTSTAERDRYIADLALVHGQVVAADSPRRAIALFDAARAAAVTSKITLREPLVLLERSRAHTRLKQFDEAAGDLESGIAIFENQRAAARTEQLRITRLDALWGLFSDLIYLRRQDPRGALEVAERSRARALLDSLAADQSIEPLRAEALHAWLPAHTTAIVYATLPDRLIVWQVTSKKVHLVERPVGGSTLDKWIDEYLLDLRSNQIGAASKRLADVLLPDRLDPGAEQTLVFLPDGPLHRVPFAALPQRATGRPVVADFIPIIAPSLSVLRLTSERPHSIRQARAVLVGYGDARTDLELPRLPGVTREIERVSKHYPNRITLVGSEAHVESIAAAAHGAGFFHFSGHAIADDIVPSQSRLMIGPTTAGDRLTPAVIASLGLQPGALVVLSACDTARGRAYRGEGAMSLARAFLIAGASAVVGSLWPVRDETTGDLLAEFHGLVAGGKKPAIALATVQRDSFRRGIPMSRWAAFEIVGASFKGW